VDTQVLRVLATDLDDALNGGIFYSITDGNADHKFRIDEASGQIALNRALDRETISRYMLTITARDAGSPTLSATATVTIDVLDENDNAPEFMHSETKITVLETLAVGSELVTFQATDADLGSNKEVMFSMQRSYQLNITASDAGSPKLVSSISFVILVEDANDNAPVFPSTAIVRQIQEGIPLNTPIVTVTAEDPDSGLNSRIRYSLIQQEPSIHQAGTLLRGTNSAAGPHFAIRPDTGVIYVIRPIDREFADTFRLTVVATDQAEPASSRISAEKLVTVIVEDVNDNAPIFTSVSAGLLPKGAQRGYVVTRVTATDADANTNGLVTYELISGDTDYFSLDRSSGRLTLRKEIPNPEATYRLSVRATDEAVHSQRKSTSTQLTIISVTGTVEDATAVGPQFSKKAYSGSVAENEPSGTNVVTVNARYPSNPLADVEYFIYNVTANNREMPLYFEIDSKSGIVSTSAILDREAGAEEYELDVIALTKGTPTPQTSSCKVSQEKKNPYSSFSLPN